MAPMRIGATILVDVSFLLDTGRISINEDDSINVHFSDQLTVSEISGRYHIEFQLPALHR